MSTYVRKKRTSPRPSPLLDLLASRPVVRILRYLVAHEGAHTGRQLAAGAEVAVARAAEAFSRLVDIGVLERRRAGRAYLYSLNETNYLVSDGLLPAFRSEAEWIERLGNEVSAVLGRKVDAVILYGSWARRQPMPTSDVDLLVVTRRVQDQDKVERILEGHRGRLAERFGRPVSLLVVGRNELRRRLRRGDRLIREIIREGRTVAGKSIAEVVAVDNRSGRRPSVPTRTVASAQATNYLRKAEDHLAAAVEAMTAERWSTVVLLTVHAAISAVDASCAASAGVRSVSQAHTDQVRLIRQLFVGDTKAKKASDHLAALLDRKNTAEYEARLFQRPDAETALKHAERLVNWARQVCGR